MELSKYPEEHDGGAVCRWKRMVRYMYEYENGRKIRNTGFVRMDCNERICRAYIHGKGIRAEEPCNIYAFYETKEAIVRILLGYVRMHNQELSGYVEMDCGHVGGTDVPFSQILGLMIGEGNGHRYMVFLHGEQTIEEVRDEPEMRATGNESEGKPGEEAETKAEEAEAEPEGEKDAGKLETESVHAEEADTFITEEFQCRRISPRELTRLGRRGRRLMNNSFLLHGYYSYHYLILSEYEDHYVLGVPGVYMEREKHAAEIFGFSYFQNAQEDAIIQSKQMPEGKAAFGYWCKFLEK